MKEILKKKLYIILRKLENTEWKVNMKEAKDWFLCELAYQSLWVIQCHIIIVETYQQVDFTHSAGITRLILFPKGIWPKVNLTAWL